MVDWDRVLERNGRMVWRTAYRLLGSAEEAQDCVQETFLSALKVSRREPVKDWSALLRHLATARALDRLRQRLRERKRESERDVTAVAQDDTNPVHVLEASELARRLREALSQLPPREAEVFALRFVEEMSHREIAQTLGLKENAVAVLLHEARTRLRSLLREQNQ